MGDLKIETFAEERERFWKTRDFMESRVEENRTMKMEKSFLA